MVATNAHVLILNHACLLFPRTFSRTHRHLRRARVHRCAGDRHHLGLPHHPAVQHRAGGTTPHTRGAVRSFRRRCLRLPGAAAAGLHLGEQPRLPPARAGPAADDPGRLQQRPAQENQRQ